MLKEYLRGNEYFRRVFAWPLRARARRISRPAQVYQRVVVGGMVILTPNNIDGHFAMAATSHMAQRIITTGCYEPEVTAILAPLSELEGDIINVGANVGLHTIWIAKTFARCKKVVAIEPNPEAYELLVENITRNGVDRVVVPVQTCAGDSPGEVELAYIPEKAEYSSIAKIVHPAVAGSEQRKMSVRMSTVDAIAQSMDLAPSLLLVDTEGSEYQVFRGSERVIKQYEPVLVFECADTLLLKFGYSSQMLEQLLNDYGYIVRNALAPTLPLKHPFDGEAIAAPRSKVSLLA